VVLHHEDAVGTTDCDRGLLYSSVNGVHFDWQVATYFAVALPCSCPLLKFIQGALVVKFQGAFWADGKAVGIDEAQVLVASF
jgi:hypothetical protein